MLIGFLHIGKSEHGVCRYGRLLAGEAKKRSDLRVLESEVILSGKRRNDTLLLTEALRKLSAQIVHIQFTEEIWGRDENRFCNLRTFIGKCKCPVVVTIHDTEPVLEYRGAGNSVIRTILRYIRQSFRRIWFVCKVLLCNCGFIRNFVPDNAWIRRWLIRKTCVSFFCTEDEKNRLLHSAKLNKAVIIPHFVENRTQLPTRGEARKLLKLEDYRVITLLGFIYGGKGYRILLEALALLPDEDILVVFAGGVPSGAESYFAGLTDLAEKMGVTGRLRVTNYLEEKKLEAYLVATDVPVCPYRVCYASGSLSTWISACNCPVITSDLPQFRDYKRLEPRFIEIFSPYTSVALAESIQKTLDRQKTTESDVSSSLTDRLPDVTELVPKVSDSATNEITLDLSRLRNQLSVKVIFDKHLSFYQRVLIKMPQRV